MVGGRGACVWFSRWQAFGGVGSFVASVFDERGYLQGMCWSDGV